MTDVYVLSELATGLRNTAGMHGATHALRLAMLAGFALSPIAGPVAVALVGNEILWDDRNNEPEWRRRVHGAVARALAQALLRRHNLPIIVADIDFVARELLLPRDEFALALAHVIDADLELQELERIYPYAPIAWIIDRITERPTSNVVQLVSSRKKGAARD